MTFDSDSSSSPDHVPADASASAGPVSDGVPEDAGVADGDLEDGDDGAYDDAPPPPAGRMRPSPPAASGAGAPAAPTPPAVPSGPSFRDLGLSEPLLRALEPLGYEVPSPIQAQTIPHILAGRDVLGQAQTGTGKTAAFALPLLSRIQLGRREPQVLVLTPTRELAIQVAEAFQSYAAQMPGFHVLPVYGGQSYPIQLRSLARGAHVVVGTPGRVMDHMRRGALRLDGLSCLVLDEADEMLRMGFLEDVTWILSQTPATRQTALFSATLPGPVRHIAQQSMRDPVEITIESRRETADLIRQRYWIVAGTHKLDALTRILETENVDGMLVFVRTKTMTTELGERLEARGFACAPLSSDVPQNIRERTIERFKSGALDVLIATDVAARGLDVDRISHVVNFDAPADIESYVHRIGRTGRAGRRGDAILFVSPRERHMFHAIERMIGRRIEPMSLPTPEQVSEQRVAKFKARIAETIDGEEDLSSYSEIVAEFAEEHEVEPLAVAAALARMVHGDRPLRIGAAAAEDDDGPPPGAGGRPRGANFAPWGGGGIDLYRVEVGLIHGARPANIVGAIANEGGIEGRRIGRIDIRDDHSLVELPSGMPDDVFQALTTARACSQELRISRVSRPPAGRGHRRPESQKRRTPWRR